MKAAPVRLLVCLLAQPLLAGVLCRAQLQPLEEDRGITGLGLALRKLPTLGSLLYITAHPDDENNALLAKVSRGQGIRTGLLTLTRGEGGQNEIGTELFEALGVLRTEELMAAHRFDGVRQFFTRAYEFGYSFSVEETLEKWGQEEILRDIVGVIRQFRPHLILTLNPEGTGGGLHHQASARLAAEAFRLAADPNRFPEQLQQEGLRPWQALRLCQASGPGLAGGERAGQRGAGFLVDLGTYDSLLGESYSELGARARSNHRSQGMNVLPRPGPAAALYRLADSAIPSPPGGDDFFQGIDVSLAGVLSGFPELKPDLSELESHIHRAQDAFSHSDYASTAGAVMAGLQLVRQLQTLAKDAEALFLLKEKETDFLSAAARSHFMHFDALARDVQDGTIVAGQDLRVEVAFLSRSSLPVVVQNMEITSPPGWEIVQERKTDSSAIFKVKVAQDVEYGQPYWFRADPRVDRFSLKPDSPAGAPFAPSPLMARVAYQSSGVTAWLKTPIQHRWFDPGSAKERRMEVQVVPAMCASVRPFISIVGTSTAFEGRPGSGETQGEAGNDVPWKTFRVAIRSNVAGAASAQVALEAPPRWEVDPPRQAVSFQYENEQATVTFRVRIPAALSTGEYHLRAKAETGGRTYDQECQTVDYHHIQTRYLYRPAVTKLKAFDVKLPSQLQVGYIMGVGDDVALATQELGARVAYLGEEDLAWGDLDRFDAIVTGVRAYFKRRDLPAYNHRLLEYVRNGGHLVVQYNKYEFNEAQYAPYPARIDQPHDRVTAEDSEVKVLLPDHPVFTWPNRITEQDWTGWVQERGLYFWGQWDERYQPLVELQDPFPYNNEPKRGGLVLAAFGKGTYLYTGLGFFRQLPEGIPGAYRLWANILSLRRARERR